MSPVISQQLEFRVKLVQCELGFKQLTSYSCSISDRAGKKNIAK